MKYSILLIFFLFLMSCSTNKVVYWCGDHQCVNKSEKENYFKKNMIVEVRTLNTKPKKDKTASEKIMLQFNMPKLHIIYDQLNQYENKTTSGETNLNYPILFNHRIELNKVWFQYETGDGHAIKDISLNITKNSIVGFVGSSGAGKTTLVDLIIGVIKPKSGKILVDGYDIHENIAIWQRQIGYIPQTIYLADTTIKSNVAFGIPEKEIDEDKVWAALSLTQLENFVKNLPNGLETVVGERGVLISGGQRQRIGNARAIYHEPKILIMDEATAALDNETERAFMEGIDQLREKKTILLIAHRLSTVKNCDVIFFLKDGQLIDHGKFDELKETNIEFRKMAHL